MHYNTDWQFEMFKRGKDNGHATGFKCKLQNCFLSFSNIIQLMHSFEVNIRICQPENSDVHRGEAEVNITFEG